MLHLCLFFVLSIIVISFYFLSPTPTAIHIFSPDSIVGLGTERTENKMWTRQRNMKQAHKKMFSWMYTI